MTTLAVQYLCDTKPVKGDHATHGTASVFEAEFRLATGHNTSVASAVYQSFLNHRSGGGLTRLPAEDDDEQGTRYLYYNLSEISSTDGEPSSVRGFVNLRTEPPLNRRSMTWLSKALSSTQMIFVHCIQRDDDSLAALKAVPGITVNSVKDAGKIPTIVLSGGLSTMIKAISAIFPHILTGQCVAKVEHNCVNFQTFCRMVSCTHDALLMSFQSYYSSIPMGDGGATEAYLAHMALQPNIVTTTIPPEGEGEAEVVIKTNTPYMLRSRAVLETVVGTPDDKGVAQEVVQVSTPTRVAFATGLEDEADEFEPVEVEYPAKIVVDSNARYNEGIPFMVNPFGGNVDVDDPTAELIKGNCHALIFAASSLKGFDPQRDLAGFKCLEQYGAHGLMDYCRSSEDMSPGATQMLQICRTVGLVHACDGGIQWICIPGTGISGAIVSTQPGVEIYVTHSNHRSVGMEYKAVIDTIRRLYSGGADLQVLSQTLGMSVADMNETHLSQIVLAHRDKNALEFIRVGCSLFINTCNTPHARMRVPDNSVNLVTLLVLLSESVSPDSPEYIDPSLITGSVDDLRFSRSEMVAIYVPRMKHSKASNKGGKGKGGRGRGNGGGKHGKGKPISAMDNQPSVPQEAESVHKDQMIKGLTSPLFYLTDGKSARDSWKHFNECSHTMGIKSLIDEDGRPFKKSVTFGSKGETVSRVIPDATRFENYFVLSKAHDIKSVMTRFAKEVTSEDRFVITISEDDIKEAAEATGFAV